ncbi:extracellular solute-binding protein [Sphaerisporangium sp. NPDC051011]|uniref:extracellular solute-binding protein n=1 Tax=Sphaerisporangium sp. NPDC051011 TaxID=3155792 RepID=UPI0033F5A3F9
MRAGKDSGAARTKRRAVLAALLLTASACTGSGPAKKDGCVLTIATGVDVSGGVRQQLLDEWNAVPGHLHACFQPISAIADDQHSEMVSAAQAGGIVYNIYNLDIQWIPEFAAGGYLEPLDEGRHEPHKGDVPDKVWEAGSFDGVQYAAPFNADVPLLYYRTGGPLTGAPKDWAAMKADAGAYAARPGVETVLAVQLKEYEGLVVNALEAVWASGGEWVDDTGQVVIDRPDGRAALRALIEAVDPSQEPRKPLIAPRALADAEDDSLTRFRQGHAAFMRNWAYAYEVLSGEEGTFSAAPLPWPGVLGGQYLAVAAHQNSEHRDQAQELVAALTGTDAAGSLYHCGGFAPARRSGFEKKAECRPTWPRPTGTPSADTPGQKVSEIAPAGILKEALDKARLRPRTPYYTQFSKVLQEQLHELMLCHAHDRIDCDNADTFAEKIAPQLRQALSGRVSQ